MGLLDLVTTGLGFFPGGGAVSSAIKFGSPILTTGGRRLRGGGGRTPSRPGIGDKGRLGHTRIGPLVMKDPGGQVWSIVGRSGAGPNAIIRSSQGAEGIFNPRDLPSRLNMEFQEQFPSPRATRNRVEESVLDVLVNQNLGGGAAGAGNLRNQQVEEPPVVFNAATMSDITPRQVFDVITDPGVDNITDIVSTALEDDPPLPPLSPSVRRNLENPDALGGTFPVAIPATLEPCLRPPKGYVVVRDPQGRAWYMRRDEAISRKLFKARAKPPFTASDWRCMRTGKRVEKRLENAAKKYLPKKVSHSRSRRPSMAAPRRETQVINVE